MPIAANRINSIEMKFSMVCIGILCSRSWSTYNHCWILMVVSLSSFSSTFLIELVYEGPIDVNGFGQGIDFINCHFYAARPAFHSRNQIISIELDFDGGVSAGRTWIYIWNSFLWSSTHFLPSSSSHDSSPYAYFTHTRANAPTEIEQTHPLWCWFKRFVKCLSIVIRSFLIGVCFAPE